MHIKAEMRYVLSTELSEKETYMIGSIISQWGFLEAEIFEQILLSLKEGEDMHISIRKNSQFSKVLEEWRTRVVNSLDAGKKKILIEQYEKIIALNEFRQAIVHSRWEWSLDAPEQITAVRVHKENVKRVSFTYEDLVGFSTDLGEIRYLIRYPRGLEDRAKEMANQRGHLSRLFWLK